MHPRSSRVLAWMIAGGAALAPWPGRAEPRWPRWPTEVSRAAAPLDNTEPGATSEHHRVLAVDALSEYATPPIVPFVVAGLRDPSAQVRRDLLELCAQRAMVECIPEAATMWVESRDSNVRVAALEVLAIDPTPSRVEILVGALRDSSDQVRSKAAEALGRAPLGPDLRANVRSALIAKLSDPAALVRRHAVASLGLLAPGDGGLAIARLLEDPDPEVRAAAATALGQHGDTKVVPALARTVSGGNEPKVVLAAAQALAVLPGDQVDEVLLQLLDNPPRGVQRARIALAIGLRTKPSDVLLRGLVQRLREDALRPAVLSALLWLGDAAKPALDGALRRGIEPHLEVEVRRLLGALDPPTTKHTEPQQWPRRDDRGAWHGALAASDLERVADATRALVEMNPPWLDDAVRGSVTRWPRRPPDRGWVASLSLAKGARLQRRDDRRAWTTLLGWARDESLAVADRCLAIAALSGARDGPADADAASTLLGLTSHRIAAIRACSVVGLRGFPSQLSRNLEALLHDPAPQARVSAALVAATLQRRGPGTTALLWLQALADPSPHARDAAKFALASPPTDAPATLAWIVVPARPLAWADPLAWIAVEHGEHRLQVPAVGDGRWRWALAPGLVGAHVIADDKRPHVLSRGAQ